jgi:hypothetical protein
MPNIPIDGIDVRLKLAEKVRAITLLPDKNEIRLREHGGEVTFRAPRLETLAMFAIELG